MIMLVTLAAIPVRLGLHPAVAILVVFYLVGLWGLLSDGGLPRLVGVKDHGSGLVGSVTLAGTVTMGFGSWNLAVFFATVVLLALAFYGLQVIIQRRKVRKA
jgi:hypothetical protein